MGEKLRRLKRAQNAVACDAIWRKPCQQGIAQADGATRRLIKSANQIDDCAFARAVRANDACNLIGQRFEAQRFYGVNAAKAHIEIFNGQRCGCRSHRQRAAVEISPTFSCGFLSLLGGQKSLQKRCNSSGRKTKNHKEKNAHNEDAILRKR